jgi:tripartite-type tricarboxylate transporter receptor subunit TctC
VAAPKTPHEIVVKLSADFVEGSAEGDIAVRCRQKGARAGWDGPKRLATMVQAETEKWTRVVRSKGFRLD